LQPPDSELLKVKKYTNIHKPTISITPLVLGALYKPAYTAHHKTNLNWFWCNSYKRPLSNNYNTYFIWRTNMESVTQTWMFKSVYVVWTTDPKNIIFLCEILL